MSRSQKHEPKSSSHKTNIMNAQCISSRWLPNHLLCTEIENLLFMLTRLSARVTYPGDCLNRDILCFWFRSFYFSKKALQGFLLVTIFVWIDTSQHQQLAGAFKNQYCSVITDPLPCQGGCQCRRCLHLCSLSLLGSACSFLRKKVVTVLTKLGSACSFLKLWSCAVG